MNSTEVSPDDIRPSVITKEFAAKVAEVSGISEFWLNANDSWIGWKDNQQVDLTKLYQELAIAWSDKTGKSLLDFDVFQEAAE